MSETSLPKEIILEMPVSELDMSEGKLRLLNESGVKTIGQLVTEFSEEDLLNIRNFGKLGVKEVESALEEIGLKLKGTEVDEV